MKKFIKIFALILTLSLVLVCTGCEENYDCSKAKRVTVNVQKEANNFSVERRVVVYNARTDKLIAEIIGYFSISNSNNELVVTCQVGPTTYKVNYVYLTEYTLYFVEDISGAHVTPYHYEIHYIPEFLQIFEVKGE